MDLFHQVADDGQLLVVLLTEIGAVGFGKVEQTTHHHGDSREMAGTLRTFHHLLQRTEMVRFLHRFGVHLLDGGDKGDIGAHRSQLLAVGIHRTGILGEVFLVVELDGVDKDADHDKVVFLLCPTYQRKMSVMQGAHGGHQSYRFAFSLGGLHGFFEFRNFSDRFHYYRFIFLSVIY